MDQNIAIFKNKLLNNFDYIIGPIVDFREINKLKKEIILNAVKELKLDC